MSSTLDPSAATGDLAALRVELDRLDDLLHDTLLARAEVVTLVAAAKGGASALRPGREAAILRRLLARHHGKLPALAIVRIWRELLAGTTSMQGNFAIAVGDTDAAFTALSREHFGALTPHRFHQSPGHAIGEVSAGMASAAVLPMPAEEANGWWTALLQKDAPRVYVVARLPIWAVRPEGAPRVEAMVVAASPPDPSGEDHSCLGLELDADISRTRLVAALQSAGFQPVSILLHKPAGATAALVMVDVAGFVAPDDRRLASITLAQRPPVVLGAYAVPLAGGGK